jgi:hypothetical protein
LFDRLNIAFSAVAFGGSLKKLILSEWSASARECGAWTVVLAHTTSCGHLKSIEDEDGIERHSALSGELLARGKFTNGHSLYW